MYVPMTGTNYLKLKVSDGTNTRILPCLELTVPNPSDPERMEQFVEGVLRSVLRGNNAVGDFSFTLPFGAFIDPTNGTPDEIFGGTGVGATWTPNNSAVAECRVDAAFRMFTFTAMLDARSMGGTNTTRTWQGYAARSVSVSRADPNAIVYTGRVYGTITDALVG